MVMFLCRLVSSLVSLLFPACVCGRAVFSVGFTYFNDHMAAKKAPFSNGSVRAPANHRFSTEHVIRRAAPGFSGTCWISLFPIPGSVNTPLHSRTRTTRVLSPNTTRLAGTTRSGTVTNRLLFRVVFSQPSASRYTANLPLSPFVPELSRFLVHATACCGS